MKVSYIKSVSNDMCNVITITVDNYVVTFSMSPTTSDSLGQSQLLKFVPSYDPQLVVGTTYEKLVVHQNNQHAILALGEPDEYCLMGVRCIDLETDKGTVR